MFIDFHCDTLLKLKHTEQELYKNTFHVDIEKMRQADCLAIFFAVFFDRSLNIPHWTLFDQLYAIYQRELAKNEKQLSQARNGQDLKINKQKNNISTFLTLEDGDVLDGSLDNLEKLHKLGVRLITLTWNYKNCLGSPNSADSITMAEGLTPFGCSVVEACNSLGVLLDVSHLSDGGFWDIQKLSKKPFIASHSNCRSLTPHRRNLTDEMIKAIGNAGGCIGLNFVDLFTKDDSGYTMEHIVNHFKHVKNVGGIDCVAIGSDFDGADAFIISDISQMSKLFDALLANGFTESEVEKLAYGNATRVIDDVLK